MRRIEDTGLIDVPRFRGFDGGPPPGFGRPGEQDWLLLEVAARYVASDVLPDLLARHLGDNYQRDYQVEVFARPNPAALIYPPDAGVPSIEQAEASVSLFDIAPPVPGGRGPGPGRGVAPPGGAGRGRWQLSVQLRAGSLEAVVARARRRNLGISAAILLLLLATGGALVRFSRQAQRLAAVEMEFVAGVSHELRTPLTVIRTAAFNLRGKLSGNSSQVERYGALIQQEAEKLTAIVEQVLRFARTRTGRIIREREPVWVENLVDDSLLASKDVLEETPCHIEKQVERGLPPILGDSTALRHALQNLINNAAKYGMEGGNWIGIFARTVTGVEGTVVELRVEDRGPGIPREERKRIFEPFFRGERALQDQIHGTGLGLNLVKKIVEAHGGTVDVESETGAGTSFVLRIPAAPTEHQDEFAHSLG